MSFATDLAACCHTTLSSYAGVFFLAQELPVTKTASTSTSVLVSSLTSLQHLFNISSTSHQHLNAHPSTGSSTSPCASHNMSDDSVRYATASPSSEGDRAVNTIVELLRYTLTDMESKITSIQNPIMYHQFVSFLMHQIDNAT
jgi:hypothetical protein